MPWGQSDKEDGEMAQKAPERQAWLSWQTCLLRSPAIREGGLGGSRVSTPRAKAAAQRGVGPFLHFGRAGPGAGCSGSPGGSAGGPCRGTGPRGSLRGDLSGLPDSAAVTGLAGLERAVSSVFLPTTGTVTALQLSHRDPQGVSGPRSV